MFKNLRRSLLALAVVAGSSVVAEVTFAAESDGTVDSGFGASGIVTVSGVGYSYPLELSNGKVVMFANIENNAQSSGPDLIKAIRLNANGTTDTSFGAAGTLEITNSGYTYYQYESAVADANGGFILAFYANAPSTYQSRLTQVTGAGVVDTGFGTNGFVDVPKAQASGTVRSINVDASSGKIYTFSDGSQTEIARFAADGSLDTTFYPGSYQNTALQTWPSGGPCGSMWRVNVKAAWVDPNETFAYVFGVKGGPSSDSVLGLAKYVFSTRTCDTTFGGDLFLSNGNRGTDSNPDGFFEYSIVPASNLKAKIYVQSDGSSYGLFKGDSSATKVAKFTSSGTLDTSYGSSGSTVDLQASFANYSDLNADLAIASDGSMRVVGMPTESGRYAKLVKLTAAGAVDTAFGTNGEATVPSCQSLSYMRSIRKSDGSILALSQSSSGMYPNTIYNTHVVKLGTGGSSSQCGTTTTTTTTTQPPMNNPNPNPNTCGGGASLNPSSRSVSGTVGQALTVAAPAVSGFSSNPSFVRTNNSFFPTGLTLNASTGAISGTPTSSAQGFTSSITVSAGNQTCYYSITWSITAPTCALGAPSSDSSIIVPDSAFGGSGYWGPTETGYRANPTGLVVGNDGAIYALVTFQVIMNTGSSSTNNYARLYKLNSAGVVDTTWGTNGYVLLDFLANNGVGSEYSDGLKKLSDGSLVIASSSNQLGSGSQRILETFITRVTTAGSIDSTWGTNGKAVLYGPATVAGGSSSYVQSFGVDASDNVYALTSVSVGGGSTSSRIAKVSSTGVKSSTFGGSGDLTLSSSAYEFSLHPSGGFFIPGSTAQSTDATVTKYDANGVVDTSFGTSGVVTIDKSTQESINSVAVMGDKIYVIHSDTSVMMQSVRSVMRLQANGSIDTTYGNAGTASMAALGSFSPWDLVPVSDGSVIMIGDSGTQSMSAAFAVLDSSGATPSGVTSPAVLTSGTCEVEYYGNPPIVFGNGFLFAGGANMGNATALIKFAVAGMTPSTGGGSTPSTPTAGAPTLVTTANQAALVRQPGTQGMVVNGQEVEIDTSRVATSGARTPASERTPAQIRALQAAGQALLQQFVASLPAGAVTNVTVVNTTTGAVMRNLVFDANGNSKDVPVEDIVILDGPSLSLMIGSDNANITSDGKYQVGAGGTVGVVGAGLGANAPGELVAMSTPTLLANFTTTATGDLSQSATLPSSIGVGDHTLVVASGNTYAVMGLRVVPSSLPTTGLTEGSGRTMVIALFTLVFAAVLVRSRRFTLLAH